MFLRLSQRLQSSVIFTHVTNTVFAYIYVYIYTNKTVVIHS